MFQDQSVFEDINPCTGEIHTVTINFLVWILETEDSFRLRAQRTGTTSDGFVVEHGKEVALAAGGSENAFFRDPWINPETGDSFVAEARFSAVDSEVLVDDFRLVCRTGPTILP